MVILIFSIKNGKYLMASWKFKSFELLIGFQDLYLYFYDLREPKIV